MKRTEVDANKGGNWMIQQVCRRLLVVIATLSVASMAFGHAYRSRINGRVTDQTGAAIVGTQVQVIDENTRFVSAVSTNSQGLYSAPSLTPGTYDVKVTAKGFGASEQTGVVLAAGDIKEVNDPHIVRFESRVSF